jgi:hypothetical protein
METIRVRDAGTWLSAPVRLLLFPAAFTLLSIITHRSTQVAVSPKVEILCDSVVTGYCSRCSFQPLNP